MKNNNKMKLDWSKLLGFKLVKRAEGGSGEKSLKNPAMAMIGNKTGVKPT